MKNKYTTSLFMAVLGTVTCLTAFSNASATCPDITAESAKQIDLPCVYSENLADSKAKTMTGATETGRWCYTTIKSAKTLSELLRQRDLTLKGEHHGNTCAYERDDKTTYVFLETAAKP